MFFDIEVSIKDGYPDMETANRPIISIAYHIKEQNHSTVLILDENNAIDEIDTPEKRILTFETEKELLKTFLEHLEFFKPTITNNSYEIIIFFSNIFNSF